MWAGTLALLCMASLAVPIAKAQGACGEALVLGQLLNSTVMKQQAEIDARQNGIDDLVTSLQMQADGIALLESMIFQLNFSGIVTGLTTTTTTTYIQSNTQCMTTGLGLLDCTNAEPPAVCCTTIDGGTLTTRCSTQSQCEASDGDFPEGSTTPLLTTQVAATTMGPTTVPLQTTMVEPTTMRSYISTLPHVQTNENCQTSQNGMADCVGASPTGVCCAREEGDEISTRCTPPSQCEAQGGTYPAFPTTILPTTTVVTTTSTTTTSTTTTTIPTTAGPIVTTAAHVQQNDYCFTTMEGMQNCSNSEPPSVCCSSEQLGSYISACSDANQCAQKGGDYPQTTTTTTTVITTTITTTTTTTVMVTTGPHIQSNSNCLTTMQGYMNCFEAAPPGVCCILETATRCVAADQCEQQGGEFPEIETTTEQLTTLATMAPTTQNAQTTAASVPTTMVMTTLVEEWTTAEWTQGNSLCLTTMDGISNCLTATPPGVCCTLQQGPSTVTKCQPSAQCEISGGTYFVDPTESTIAPPVSSTLPTTLAVTTMNEETTAAVLMTTLVETTEEAYVSTAVHVDSNSACMTTQSGLLNCVASMPPGVCCTATQGPDTLVRCQPEMLCGLMGGSFPADPTTMEIYMGNETNFTTLGTTPAVALF